MLVLGLFVLQLLLFTTLTIGLHYASPRIGIFPLLVLTIGCVGLLNIIELNRVEIMVELANMNLIVRPGAHVLIPIVLAIILLVYTVDGTRIARMTLGAVIGVSLLAFLMLSFMLFYSRVEMSQAIVDSALGDNFDLEFVRGVAASLAALTADTLIIIIVYQGIHNLMRWIPSVVVPAIALVVALWTDAALFNLLAFIGTDAFGVRIPADIVMKTAAGLLIAPLIGVYLTRFAPRLPAYVGVDNRNTFDILFSKNIDDAHVASLENQLRISRSIYTQLTENIGEVFWLIDVDEQRFLYVSPAYERVTGYAVAPLYDDVNHILTIMDPDERDMTPQDVLRFLTGERNSEFRIVRADGRQRWIRARAFPIKDQKGNIVRYAGLAEDVTEQKRLTEHAFELAIAEERVRVLHNFISDASHDLKTPISAMMLKLSLLDSVTDETRRKELRSELRERALYLSELITDLFTLSKIEGQSDIAFVTLDVDRIVQGVVNSIRPLAEEKSLTLTHASPDGAVQMQGDDEQLVRMVSNLLSNAIRYTREGGVTVTLSADDENITLAVTDTGIGIPEEHQAQIFERFFRTQSARDTQEGTGLGLAITQAIVRRHRGSITVDSIVGQGSTFTVVLPRTQPKLTNAVDISRSTQEVRALTPADLSAFETRPPSNSGEVTNGS